MAGLVLPQAIETAPLIQQQNRLTDYAMQQNLQRERFANQQNLLDQKYAQDEAERRMKVLDDFRKFATDNTDAATRDYLTSAMGDLSKKVNSKEYGLNDLKDIAYQYSSLASEWRTSDKAINDAADAFAKAMQGRGLDPIAAKAAYNKAAKSDANGNPSTMFSGRRLDPTQDYSAQALAMAGETLFPGGQQWGLNLTKDYPKHTKKERFYDKTTRTWKETQKEFTAPTYADVNAEGKLGVIRGNDGLIDDAHYAHIVGGNEVANMWLGSYAQKEWNNLPEKEREEITRKYNAANKDSQKPMGDVARKWFLTKYLEDQLPAQVKDVSGTSTPTSIIFRDMYGTGGRGSGSKKGTEESFISLTGRAMAGNPEVLTTTEVERHNGKTFFNITPQFKGGQLAIDRKTEEGKNTAVYADGFMVSPGTNSILIKTPDGNKEYSGKAAYDKIMSIYTMNGVKRDQAAAEIEQFMKPDGSFVAPLDPRGMAEAQRVGEEIKASQKKHIEETVGTTLRSSKPDWKSFMKTQGKDLTVAITVGGKDKIQGKVTAIEETEKDGKPTVRVMINKKWYRLPSRENLLAAALATVK